MFVVLSLAGFKEVVIVVIAGGVGEIWFDSGIGSVGGWEVVGQGGWCEGEVRESSGGCSVDGCRCTGIGCLLCCSVLRLAGSFTRCPFRPAVGRGCFPSCVVFGFALFFFFVLCFGRSGLGPPAPSSAVVVSCVGWWLSARQVRGSLGGSLPFRFLVGGGSSCCCVSAWRMASSKTSRVSTFERRTVAQRSLSALLPVMPLVGL